MFYRKSFMGIGAAVGAILSGVLSHGAHSLHFNGPPIPKKTGKRPAGWTKRGSASVHRGWRAFAYEVNRDPNSREATRRREQGAHHLQRLSHKPGTVQPRHIFATEA